MNSKLENVEKNIVQLEIEIPADKFEESMTKAFNKNKGRFAVPGFRKGKAPRNIVLRYYGEGVLYEDAINFACPEAYDKAVEEHDLNPVDRPEIDVVQVGSGQNFIFTAKVTVKPEVELGEYFGLEVEKPDAEVTDEDVQKELDKVAERNSRMVTIDDRDIINGDTVNINFEGSVDGEVFEGGTGTDYDLVIGSGTFIPGFEEQLIGKKTDEEVDVNVTFPEDYQAEELAGKEAVFNVKINEIKVKELPEIDDEFAKDVSEFETLEDYKNDIKSKLTETKEKDAKQKLEDSVIKKAVENSTIELPEVMIENQIDSILRNFDRSLRYQGMDLHSYIQMLGMDINNMRAQYKNMAEEQVRTQLVLEAISKKEDVNATDDELEEEIKKNAERMKQEIEDFKKHLRPEDIEYIKENLIIQNTIALLVEKAVVK